MTSEKPVVKILEPLMEELGEIEERLSAKIDLLLGRMEKRVELLELQQTQLAKCVMGNGQPESGLLVRLVFLERSAKAIGALLIPVAVSVLTGVIALIGGMLTGRVTITFP